MDGQEGDRQGGVDRELENRKGVNREEVAREGEREKEKVVETRGLQKGIRIRIREVKQKARQEKWKTREIKEEVTTNRGQVRVWR